MLKTILLDEDFLKAIISSLILIILGFVLRRMKIVGNKTKNILCFIVLKISLPVLAFTAFLNDFNKQKFRENLIIFLLSFSFFLFFLFLGSVIFQKYPKEKRKVYAIFISIGQLTFFSIPVLKAIYGDNVMIMVNMVTFPFRFVLYIYCYFAISKLSLSKENIKVSLKKFLLNPIMIAMFVGLLIWLTQNVMIHVGENQYSLFRIDQTVPVLYKILKVIQWFATPLAMLIIGITLGESKIGDAFKDKIAWLCSIFRTIIVPLIILGILIVLSITNIYVFNTMAAGCLVIGFAAPLSAVVNTYCMHYHNEADCASRTCFLSTILCVVSIPTLYVLIEVLVKAGVFC